VDGYLAVASAGAFIGNADLLNHRRRECERRHARLQQQGTRSAHLTIQSIGDTFANWSEDFYIPSVETTGRKVVSQSCSVTVFEDLEQRRGRIPNASKFQQWAFRELKRLTTYEARAKGIAVESVRPAYTSQRCSHAECGFTHEDDGDELACQNCGKELRADYNAARNIAHRYVKSQRRSGPGRATNHSPSSRER